MNLRNLQTFVIVADAGGFAKASGRLHLSQPAASRQILALEQELGVALFDRIGRRLQLTSEGEDLLRRSRRLLEDATALGERARALKAGQVGTLRVGAPTQVIENLLAPFVPQFQRRHPGIDVLLLEAAAVRLQSYIDRGDVHIGIMPSGFDPFEGPVQSLAPHTLLALASEGYGIAVVPSDVRAQQRSLHLVPLVHRGAPIGRWAAVTRNPRRFLAPYAEQFIDELLASARRGHPGRNVTRRAPPLPQPPRAREMSAWGRYC